MHGDNVAIGYWQKPEATERTFSATIVNPSEGTPAGPWLRTGDSGFLSEGELFIMGRIKDLLIVYGRNHSPDDIEATIQTISPAAVRRSLFPSMVLRSWLPLLNSRRRTSPTTRRRNDWVS